MFRTTRIPQERSWHGEWQCNRPGMSLTQPRCYAKTPGLPGGVNSGQGWAPQQAHCSANWTAVFTPYSTHRITCFLKLLTAVLRGGCIQANQGCILLRILAETFHRYLSPTSVLALLILHTWNTDSCPSVKWTKTSMPNIQAQLINSKDFGMQQTWTPGQSLNWRNQRWLEPLLQCQDESHTLSWEQQV